MCNSLQLDRETPSSLSRDNGQRLSADQTLALIRKDKPQLNKPCVHNRQLTAITPQGILSGKTDPDWIDSYLLFYRTYPHTPLTNIGIDWG